MSGLTKKQTALIRSLYTRHGRKKSDLCICEGERCCSEIFSNLPDSVVLAVRSDVFSVDYHGVEFVTIPDSEFKAISSTVASQGVLALVKRPEPLSDASVPEDPFILVLDRIADPGNFGTILRTAEAIGLKEVWYTAGSADPFSDKVIRAAMSAQFKVHLRLISDLEELQSKLWQFGYKKIYRTDPHHGEDCFREPELFDRTALIIGNEANGAASLTGAIDVTIPMPGSAESLNAAQAATVFLFEFVRRSNL